MNRRTFWITTLAVALIAPLFALAQNQGQGRRSPEERRKEMMARLQEQLGATADEMQVITPKLEKVTAAQQAARSGMGFGGFGGGGRGGRGGGPGGPGGPGGDANQPETPLRKAATELRSTLETKDAPVEQVTAKLAAFREARAKARADVEAAQKELVAILTPRQEAVMVSAGIVD